MASDEKEDKSIELTETIDISGETTQTEDLVALGLEADSGTDDDVFDIDITGDEDIDFADEDDDLPKGRGFDLKKIMAPALVLVVAAGAGGYIVMNPQILGQRASTLPQPAPSYVAESSPLSPFADSSVPQNEGAEQGAEPLAESTPFSPTPDVSTASLPQPTVNQNEFSAQVSDLPEMTEMTEMPEILSPPSEKMLDVSTVPSAPVVPEENSVKEKLDNDLSALDFPEGEGFGGAPKSVFETDEAKTPDILEVEAPIQPPAISSVSSKEREKNAAVFEEDVAGATAEPVAPSKAASVAVETYFDGRVPTGPLATAVGPRKVDPVLEPATQYVVVKKNYDAKDAEAVLVAANRALKLKRYESALDMFNRLYKKNPRDPRILMGRAVAQQNSGLTESAFKSYEELLVLKPNDSDAMLNMLGLLRQQYPSVALRRLMELYKLHPGDAGIAAQIGVTQADLGHYEDAMRYLGIALSLEPKNAQHAFNMAIISDRNGEVRSAVRYYEQALEMDAVYSRGRSIPRETIYDRLAILRRR